MTRCTESSADLIEAASTVSCIVMLVYLAAGVGIPGPPDRGTHGM